MDRDFTLKVSPRMLELLSRDLYTNMYFVLAELIANAYDADAENVYVFVDDNEVRVEDDGNGMSDDVLDDKYLLIGGESRTCEANARTQKKRLKMGRKGVGKLAALSIFDGLKLITVQDSKKIGLFVRACKIKFCHLTLWNLYIAIYIIFKNCKKLLTN